MLKNIKCLIWVKIPETSSVIYYDDHKFDCRVWEDCVIQSNHRSVGKEKNHYEGNHAKMKTWREQYQNNNGYMQGKGGT